MKKLLLYGFLLIDCGSGAEPMYHKDNVTVYEEVDDIIEHAKMDCVRFIYQKVKSEVEKVKLVDNDPNRLYEQVMPIFAHADIKKIIKIGSVYLTPAQLYEEAARLSRRVNDLDTMIVLHIQAELVSTVWYTRALFALGVTMGIAAMLCYRGVNGYLMKKHYFPFRLQDPSNA